MVTAECHAHIFMDGVDYKKAAAAHENGPQRLGKNPYGIQRKIRTGRVFLHGALRRSTGSHTAHRFLRFTGRAVMEKLSDAHFQTGKSIARLCVKYAVRAEILSRS